MAKVKKCLDAGCVEYIFLDDNTAIVSPKNKCELKSSSTEKFNKEYVELIKGVKETIYVSKPIKLKEGQESPF